MGQLINALIIIRNLYLSLFNILPVSIQCHAHFNQINFPLPAPFLQLFLSNDCLLNIFINLIINQIMHLISFGEPISSRRAKPESRPLGRDEVVLPIGILEH